MHCRSCITLAILVITSWSSGLPTPGRAAEREFNLEQRKQKQPWLWQAPVAQALPLVKNLQWPSSAEDHFVLQRLEAAGLSPAPRADERTWLRRTHFAITGLPPSLKEIHDFLSDAKPGARERAVDRLLASPHFGERWARHWMDLVRYAETRGHEGDYLIANAWRYRDYLIRAFNDDLPYDQFLLEHLAGDLMPKPRLRPGTEINESVIATGWAFLGEENHSPVDIRQDECERIDNKVDVFSKTFLGLTISCARCHDHKFDPIRAQDYYAMSGFFLSSRFRQVRFEAIENNRRMAAELTTLRAQWTPRLAQSVAKSYERGVEEMPAYLLAAGDLIASRTLDRNAVAQMAMQRSLQSDRLQRWITHLGAARTNAASSLRELAETLASGGQTNFLSSSSGAGKIDELTSAALDKEIRVLADFTRDGAAIWKVDGEAFGSRPARVGDVTLSREGTNPIVHVMTYGAARRDLFWNRIKTAPDNENDSGALGAVARSGQTLSTPTVTLSSGKLHYLIRGKTRVYAAVDSHLMIEGPLHGRLMQRFDTGTTPEPQWVTHDLSAYKGHRTHLEFGPEGDGELEVLQVVEADAVPRWKPSSRHFNVPASAQSKPDVAAAFQKALVAVLTSLSRSGVPPQTMDADESALANWLFQNAELFRDQPHLPLVHQWAQFQQEQQQIADRVMWESHTAVAWIDGTGVDENVLLRGKPFQPGPLSPRSLPVAFKAAKPLQSSSSSGRLPLAEQLIDPENPLVARAIVNRVWHHVFGRGIVATVDNFGALGERPSHPELLDHLAWQFVHKDAWSIQKLIRRLVLTQTFAMSSRAIDRKAEEKDPNNVLLHRMSVRRLEGEAIRDATLTVSGRLNPMVGGPPVPLYLTEFLVGRGRPDKSGPLDGNGRRSLYATLHRNFLPTLMQTFDAPTPFSTVGKRNVTNVPAQSLALMNDEFFHQQAKVWAERSFRETPKSSDIERIRELIEAAYGRKATSLEARDCSASLVEFRRLNLGNAETNLAAWSDLCHALLNANDFIYVK